MLPSLAAPLALAYAGLIVYASLFPFGPWRELGADPWAYLSAGWPRYWSAFDVGVNLLGYAPLGFLLTLVGLRRWTGWRALALACLVSAGLALVLEGLQSYLPQRVPSNLDALLNALGAMLGAATALWLGQGVWLARWHGWRQAWFAPEARSALLLLLAWPLALWFPTAIPLGLGQVQPWLGASLALWLQDVPAESTEWLIALTHPLPQARTAWTDVLCVALGLWLPTGLAYSVVQGTGRRLMGLLWISVVGVATLSLSFALSHGPQRAWAWWQPHIQGALLVAWVGAALAVGLSRRAVSALTLLLCGANLSLINQLAVDPYFAQTLLSWEQGRFMRFHGLAQWLGWLWPYALCLHLLMRLSRRGGP